MKVLRLLYCLRGNWGRKTVVQPDVRVDSLTVRTFKLEVLTEGDLLLKRNN
jgi:hypothetical protein